MVVKKYLGKYRNGSARCPSWDYSSYGSYFITICTKYRSPDFGEIEDNHMNLNDTGRMVDNFWHEIPIHFPFVRLDEYVVMPDHIHGILCLNPDTVDDRGYGCRNVAMQRSYNTNHNNTNHNNTNHNNTNHNNTNNYPSRLYNLNRSRITYHGEHSTMSAISPNKHSLATVIRSFKSVCSREIHKYDSDFKWQPRYHDRIVRNQYELRAFRKYIIENPQKWNPEPF